MLENFGARHFSRNYNDCLLQRAASSVRTMQLNRSRIAVYLAICVVTPRLVAQSPKPPGIPITIQETEGPFRGIWAWNGNHFDGHWNNGAIATLVVRSFTPDSVVIERTDATGVSAGLTAVYTGRLSRHRNSIVNGKVTWTWPRVPGYPYTGAWTAAFACTPGASYELPMNFQHQEQSLWCWAASAQMLMQTTEGGQDIKQCVQAQLSVPKTVGSCCPGERPDMPPGCNHGGNILPDIEQFGFRGTYERNPLSYEEIEHEIFCEQRPIAFEWRYVGDFLLSSAAHDMIIYGYETAFNEQFLWVYDPGADQGKGAREFIPYDEYAHPGGVHIIFAGNWYGVERRP